MIIGPNFVKSCSLLPKDVIMTRCQPIVRTNLFKSNSSLPVVDGCDALASLITSITILEPPSFWYNLSDNGAGSFCELLRLESCVF